MDAAVPGITPRLQGVVELRQRLVARGGAELLRLDVGQGFEAAGGTWASITPTLGETFGRLGTRVGWFSAQGVVRIDPVAERFARVPLVRQITPTRLAARADLSDGRRGAYVAYEELLMEGTARARQPIDLLFLIDRGFTSATRLRQINLGAFWDFGPVSLRYDALVNEPSLDLFVLAQQTYSVGIAPACDCWRLDIAATQAIYPVVLFPSFGATVTISKFGSIGAR